ncbi:hypothetical protein vseg_007889 [Gypsophila vaccaria]
MEFEMQLQMAMAATAVETPTTTLEEPTRSSLRCPSSFSSPFKKLKRIAEESPSTSHVISTAIGSKKLGVPLYWAEVFFNGENMTGKWVHIDVVNSIIDGELKVEALASACKRSLRYVVAFAGRDVVLKMSLAGTLLSGTKYLQNELILDGGMLCYLHSRSWSLVQPVE